MKQFVKISKWTLILLGGLLACLGIKDIVKEKDFYVQEINLIKYKLFDDFSYLHADFHWLWGDTLELSQNNEKCGEWGGDIERIRVFRKSNESEKLFGYYIKETYNCDTLVWVGYVNPTIFKSETKEFTNRQITLLKDAILDLTKNKLNNRLVMEHSGIANTVQIKGNDESFKIFIQDYPSFEWKKFHKLKSKMIK